MLTFDHILIRYGELALKGKNRHMFEKQLVQNIRSVLKPSFPRLTYHRTFGRILLGLNGEDPVPIKDKLRKIFGIHSFSLAIRVTNELDKMKQAALHALQASEGEVRTFKINARRAYKPFPISSSELNHHLGGFVLANTDQISVDVHSPDVEIKVEVRESGTYIMTGEFKGLGGLPVGTSGKVLLMLSGGIDSPVAGYYLLKRGVTLEAIHFHSPPFTNEKAKQKVVDLAAKLTNFGGQVKLHIVPFTELQKHIHEKVPSNMEMTIMRRMMLRISEGIAKKIDALAIATGESLGQVASQTLHSMNTINEVTNTPVLRPLLTMDKEEVITVAKEIDTFNISILPYEDCCTIFLPPDSKTKPTRQQAEKFEQFVETEAYVQAAIEGTETMVIKSEAAVSKTEMDELL
ncbi:tRNA 4-thiouridine(8) synthase ThiI [Halalkalibacterium halodurans]|uniref:tRNA uracil 4-sulfurtransferase ThiI n=1 Tax=Halalkalibacterium halodurans TaxID=86665 RepID=UPI0010676D31|nr:tRNA uracil 4-sulfurtransferase ThiI [Halalkalibacterium halodurans]TES58256.1 tRNA 4-thiouridine(8) synthase ThiI [Halalkalibacterium halodurans]